MPTTGRRPYSTFDVVPFGSGERRLRPPAGLPDPERRVFLDLVATTPPSQFAPSDLALLVRWCELVVLAARAAEGMRSAPLVTADGKPSPWVALHASAVKGITMLALKLKLSPQARAPKAPKKLPGPMSYYERMNLEGERREDQEQ
jgi:hypothetical protein